MKNNVFIFITLLASIIIFNSCEKKTGTFDANSGKEYYPIKTGKTIVYKVDSTIYNDFDGTILHKTAYIKDVIDTTFLDLKKDTSYFVNRYYKTDSMADYDFFKLYYVTKYNNRIETVYDNLRYVNLVFPVTYLFSWGGNDYISTLNEPYAWLGEKPYYYKNVGAAYNTDSLSFSNTVTVFQQDALDGDTSKTSIYGTYNYGIEIYAKNVGLINKEISSIKRDKVSTKGNLKGFAIKMQCIAYY